MQVEQAPDGRRHGELSHRLGVRVHNALLKLVHEGRIGRERYRGQHLYVSAAAFAALDADARTRALDGLPIETVPALFASPTVIGTASPPKRDRALVRSEALHRRIRAAASSRAPRRTRQS